MVSVSVGRLAMPFWTLPVNKIQSYMDKGMFSCGVFIDLQKAFDTVDHAILLQKLFHYGVRGIVNDWFSSCLSEILLL